MKCSDQLAALEQQMRIMREALRHLGAAIEFLGMMVQRRDAMPGETAETEFPARNGTRRALH